MVTMGPRIRGDDGRGVMLAPMHRHPASGLSKPNPLLHKSEEPAFKSVGLASAQRALRPTPKSRYPLRFWLLIMTKRSSRVGSGRAASLIEAPVQRRTILRALRGRPLRVFNSKMFSICKNLCYKVRTCVQYSQVKTDETFVCINKRGSQE
jgi:hypothetical protein